MGKQSAGILMYRLVDNNMPQVFWVHPGGPFWRSRDAGAWSIPKGEFENGEDPLEAAKREFEEETGFSVKGKFIAIGSVKLKSGKIIKAWALEGNIDASKIKSNHFEMEWPPGSGKKQIFPEVDKAAWFDLETAKIKLNEKQVPFIENLVKLLGS